MEHVGWSRNEDWGVTVELCLCTRVGIDTKVVAHQTAEAWRSLVQACYI